MFFKRDSKLSIDKIPDLKISAEISGLAVPGPAVAPSANPDLALKLLASLILLIQAAGCIYGYSVLMGEYDELGIDINEITLSTPTLLFYGYLYFFSSLMKASESLPTIVPGAFALGFFLFSAGFLKLVYKSLTHTQLIGLASWVGIALFVTFFVPALSVQKGVSNARELFSGESAWAETDKIKRLHSVETQKGTLSGQLVLADAKHTFLLVGRKLYKVDSATGRIAREVELSPKPK